MTTTKVDSILKEIENRVASLKELSKDFRQENKVQYALYFDERKDELLDLKEWITEKQFEK